VSLLRAPLPNVPRHAALVAIARILPCSSGHRALVAAGAEAAVQALLAAGPAAPRAADGAEPPPMELGGGYFARPATWADVEEAASEVLEGIRRPPPADGRPAAADGTPQCALCGKLGAAMPGGRPLMCCGGCRGPERWCSKECQRASWLGGHRELCKQRQAAAAAAAPAGPRCIVVPATG
jgi:hypothetical protein